MDILFFENKFSKNTFDRLNSYVTGIKEQVPKADDFFLDLVSSMEKRREPSRSAAKEIEFLSQLVTFKGEQYELRLTKLNQ